MFWVLVGANLKHRPARTILTALLIAAPLAWMLLLGGWNLLAGIAGALHCFAVVFISTHAAANRRTRETALLRALGATRLFVIKLLLAEAFAFSLGGTAVAAVATCMAGAIGNVAGPARLPWSIEARTWSAAFGIVLGAALLGGLLSGWAANRRDLVEALDHD